MDYQSIMRSLLTSVLNEKYYQSSLHINQSLDQSSMQTNGTELKQPKVGTRRMLGRISTPRETGMETMLSKESRSDRPFESDKNSVGRQKFWVNKRTQSRRSNHRNKREIHRQAKKVMPVQSRETMREKRVIEREKPSRELRVVGSFSRKSRFDRPLAAFVMSLDTSRGNQYIPILPRHLRKP